MTDIRGRYWLEASANITLGNSLDINEPEFWASWISALVNATMASAPDSVMAEVAFLTEERERTQRDAQYAIKKKLRAR